MFILKIMLVVLALLAVVIISQYYGKKVSDGMGRNVAEKHFKEQWGMDDKKEYHD